MAISLAVVRRRSGYQIASHPQLRGEDGLEVQAPLWMLVGDQPGQLEAQARDRLESVIRSAEMVQDQEPRTGPESVNTVTYADPFNVQQSEGFVRRRFVSEPTLIEVWRD